MAGAETSMQLVPIDHINNLFQVSNAVSSDLEKKIVSTEWTRLQFVKQPGQETWSRRLIINDQLEWINQWDQEMHNSWQKLQEIIKVELYPYVETAFWLDEPGFACGIHTDGDLPGSLQLNWIGDKNLATEFYHTKNFYDKRFSQPFIPNTGYAMVNMPGKDGSRYLQWHGMLNPVPQSTVRVTSYVWLLPVK
jgi:hypothetical protein